MPKGYWVTIYRSISDQNKLAAYAKLAPIATAPFGGKYLARGTASNAATTSGSLTAAVLIWVAIMVRRAAAKSMRLLARQW